MKSLIVAAALCLALPAFGQADLGPAVKQIQHDPAGARNAIGVGNVVSVTDYSPFCDGSVHPLSGIYGTLAAAQKVYPHVSSLSYDADWAAINEAIIKAKTYTYGTKLLFPAGKTCVVSAALNFTNIALQSFIIDGAGASVNGSFSAHTHADVVFDAIGSRWIVWKDLHIVGNVLSPPYAAIQIGRTGTDANSNGDQHHFQNIYMEGAYTFTDLYNNNSETTKFDHVFFWNVRTSTATPATSTYTLVQDGYNYWDVASHYATITAPVDTPQSFNEDLCENCDFRNSGGGNGIWMMNTKRHTYTASFIGNSGGSGQHGVVLQSESSADSNLYLKADIHIETTSLADSFFLTGSNGNPFLTGLKYHDQGPQAGSYIFGTDTNITAPILTSATLEIGTVQSGVVLFHNRSGFWFDGYAQVPDGSFNLDNGGCHNNNPTWAGIKNADGEFWSCGIYNMGAQLDLSGVRVTATAAGTYTVLDTSLLRLVQTGTIATFTIVLRTDYQDGSPIQLVNYAGAITALTFSPAVQGFTNGSAFAANSGLRIRWDATDSKWHREQ